MYAKYKQQVQQKCASVDLPCKTCTIQPMVLQGNLLNLT